MTCAPLFFVFRCCGFFSPARRAGDGKELKNDPKANCPENRAKTTHTLNHGVESRADDLAKPRKSVIFFIFLFPPLLDFFAGVESSLPSIGFTLLYVAFGFLDG
jgi:hypothetical protein